MITIDGSRGEGGGQVLRSALGLSLVTGKPFEIFSIRAGRKRPGLMRQHLTAVNAATEVGKANVTGASINSSKLSFSPSGIYGGKYRFAISTAGSCTLVLQTVLPGLLMADKPSELILEGGTHNPFAPPFDFLEKAFLPLLKRMGADVEMTLERPGFYPAGGGRFVAKVNPATTLNPINILDRGDIINKDAVALVSHIEDSIGYREVKELENKLCWPKDSMKVRTINNSIGPGNIIVASIQSDALTEVFTGFGQKGVKAECVARNLAKQVRQYLPLNAPVGEYLADQLLIPMAMAGEGSYRTLALSNHTKTNMEIVQMFLDVSITYHKVEDHIFEVSIKSKS